VMTRRRVERHPSKSGVVAQSIMFGTESGCF
jgi:hypothetical protein